jgi:hypothetical protein
MSMEQGGLGNLGTGKTTLGSLAQSARNKHIKTARGVLLTLGVVLLLFFGALLAVVSNNPGNLDPQQLQASQIVLSILMGEAVVYIILGLLTRKYPVPATILGLTLFTADSAFWLAHGTMMIGPLWSLLIFVALIKAVQSAIAYRKESRASALQVDPLA